MSMLRTIARAIRKALASVARVALYPVRLVDGTLGWIWDTVRGGGAPAAFDEDIVETVADRMRSDVQTPDDDDRWRRMGLRVQASARAIMQGQTTDRTDTTEWLRTLPTAHLAAVLAADPLVVGRHMVGVETLKLDGGESLGRPDPAEAQKRLQTRIRERERAQLAADDKRARERSMGMTPRLLPGLS